MQACVCIAAARRLPSFQLAQAGSGDGQSTHEAAMMQLGAARDHQQLGSSKCAIIDTTEAGMQEVAQKNADLLPGKADVPVVPLQLSLLLCVTQCPPEILIAQLLDYVQLPALHS